MSMLRRAGALVFGAVLTAALVALSHVRIPVHETSDALLRVAMSARPERIERCRAVSEAEQANTPAHMRQQTICEGAAAAYRLEVLRNGAMLTIDTVRGGGMRHDRQLYVLADFVVPSGTSEIEVRVTRIDGPADADSTRDSTRRDGMRRDTTEHDEAERDDDDDDVAGDRDRIARARRAADAIPPRLLLRETVTLVPREIVLVTYDRESRQLRTSRGP